MSLEENQPPNHEAVDLYVYLLRVLVELHVRVHDDAYETRTRETIQSLLLEEGDEEQGGLSASPEGVRSALAACCLAERCAPAAVAKLPFLASPEPPSPAVVFGVIAAVAARETCVDLPATDEDWRNNRALRARAQHLLDRFIDVLLHVAQTERCNIRAGQINDAGERIPHKLSDCLGTYAVQGFHRDAVLVMFTHADLLLVFAEGVSFIPPDRRAAATIEMFRYVHLASIGKGAHADFSALVDIAIAIYG